MTTALRVSPVRGERFRDIQLGLIGGHQASNAGTALMSLSLAFPEVVADLDAVTSGLRQVRWPGRFELVREAPAVVVDGAHNVASMEVLSKALADIFPSHDLVVVFGAYRDKDLPAMLGQLQDLDPLLIATKSNSPRAGSTATIREAAGQHGLTTLEQGSVSGALRLALDAAGPDTVIVATGSLSVVAEARKFFGLARVSAVEREILAD